eukprot:TRINITY_DN3976_c0_g1_i1.p1 TRINITY_DN3976_c0_g1~~TRINITY_DN3976_c0_g1_i1.p1  ORF type:complete len:238 (-),score=36.66 TRINITY_DN3976_c0_g1_i1:43-756(-)
MCIRDSVCILLNIAFCSLRLKETPEGEAYVQECLRKNEENQNPEDYIGLWARLKQSQNPIEVCANVSAVTKAAQRDLKTESICQMVRDDESIRKSLFGQDADLESFSCQAVIGLDSKFIDKCLRRKEVISIFAFTGYNTKQRVTRCLDIASLEEIYEKRQIQEKLNKLKFCSRLAVSSELQNKLLGLVYTERSVIRCAMIDNSSIILQAIGAIFITCLLYTSPSPRDRQKSRMPSSA